MNPQIDPYLYETLADKIASLIDKRTFLPGEKVPSVRRLSLQENVSISTVLQAYVLLEDRGLIEARPQSGYYVRLQRRALPPEPAISKPSLSASRVNVSELVASIHDAITRPDIVPLGAATPSPELLPMRKLNRILASIARESDGEEHSYGMMQGSEELRHQIARRSLDWGCSFSGADVVITFGCTEAINLCLRAVAQPGDTIAVESPTYYGFLQIIESLKMKALEIPTCPRDGICVDALEQAIKKQQVKACLIVSNFSNPLGCYMPEERKKQLVELLSRKQIPLIEDDIYGEIYFGNERPKVCKAFDQQGLVLLCSSYSKCLSPGYRVGWTAPGRFKDEVRRLKLMNTLSCVLPTQITIAEMLRSGGYDHHMRRIRRAYSSQVQKTSEAIAHYFPRGTRVTRPQGGFVLWAELPNSVDSLELYRKALDSKISIAPGSLFSPKQHYRNCIRLNCAHPWSDKIDQALATLGRLAYDCGSV
ncbi:PLP-dependent aminotransferase family protein [bacterium]|nr:PLP-dependent aminotransferase family protein [bacterium]MCI0602183.1 PLP-dependent aminotransferase family protein [bacterium]